MGEQIEASVRKVRQALARLDEATAARIQRMASTVRFLDPLSAAALFDHPAGLAARLQQVPRA